MKTVGLGKKDSLTIESHPKGALLSWRSERAVLDGYELQSLIQSLTQIQKEQA